MKKRILGRIELTRLSSKGQIVVPKSMRKAIGAKSGSVFAISSPKRDMLVLKKVENPILKEDLEILKEIEKAWKETKKSSSKDEFLKELRKW